MEGSRGGIEGGAVCGGGAGRLMVEEAEVEEGERELGR